MKFSNQNRTVRRTQNIGYDTCYGSSWMNPQNSKVHTYKIRIDKVKIYLWIGIATNDNHQTSSGYRDVGNGSICTDGSWHSTSDQGSEKDTISFKTGDVITLIINFSDQSLTYKINDQVKCKDVISNVPCKLAITMGEQAQLTILQYHAESPHDDIKEKESQFQVLLFM